MTEHIQQSSPKQKKGGSYVLGHDCNIAPSLGDRFGQRVHTRWDNPYSSTHGCGSSAHPYDSRETDGRRAGGIMKRVFYIVALFALVASAAAAQDRGFGLGVILGEPTGVSAKGWISSRTAFDAGLAWSFRRAGYLHVHMDYLWHFQDVVTTSQQVIPYIGIGGRVGARDNSAIVGVRIPFGISWIPTNAPIDVFLEIAPIMDLTPETDFNANGGIGVRFYFR